MNGQLNLNFPDHLDQQQMAQNLKELQASIDQCVTNSSAILTLEQNLKAHVLDSQNLQIAR